MAIRGIGGGELSTSAALSKLGGLHPSPVSRVHPHTFVTSQLRPMQAPHLDTSNWNATLSELRHSIQQVKEDLASAHRRQQKTGPDSNTYTKDKEGHLSHSDNDLDISDQSLLSRSDLSSHTSHSTLVHS